MSIFFRFNLSKIFKHYVLLAWIIIGTLLINTHTLNGAAEDFYFQDFNITTNTTLTNSGISNIGNMSDYARKYGADVLLDNLQTSKSILSYSSLFQELAAAQEANPDLNIFNADAFINNVNLNSYRLVWAGSGSLNLFSHTIGTGSVIINMSNGGEVNYITMNGAKLSAHTGGTSVIAGNLNLFGLNNNNDLINHSLTIGAGRSAAVVNQYYMQGGDVIDNSTLITINQLGSYILHSENGSIDETVGNVILNGGSIINQTINKQTTNLHIGTLTLCADSIIDLGESPMNIDFSDSSKVAWTQGSRLIIKNFTSGVDTITIAEGGLTDTQLSQIFFEDAYGCQISAQAALFERRHIRPIPEASTLWSGTILVLSMGVHAYRRFLVKY